MPPGGVDPDDYAACDFDGDGDVDFADFAAIPRAAGEVDTGATYTWNAENRLVSVARTHPALAADPNEPPPVKVEFRYDYLGRRIEKRVLPWNPALNGGAGGWDAGSPTKVTRFVWSGWLMLLELDGLNDCGTPGNPAECIVRKYTWGLDLAGQNGQVNSLESAGAIGGLLAAYDASRNRPLWYFYDANGNVGQVVTMFVDEGTVYGDLIPAARCEYELYGSQINARAANEYEEPLRFSTKQFDAETGMGYWGYRYYSPALGRWVNRDPTKETGGLSLYSFVENGPVERFDPLGQQSISGCCGPDITQRLFQLLRRLQRIYYTLSPREQMRMCRTMISGDGWDIAELFFSGSSAGHAAFESGGCGTGSCAGTVQVFGKCYRSNEVNYALWGKAFSLCRATRSNWTKLEFRKTGPGEWDWVRVDLDGVPAPSSYSCDEAVRWVRLRRAVGARFQRVAPNAAGAGTAGCRAAWTRVGCNLDTSAAAACTVLGCGTGCCNSPYSGSLSAHVGTGDDAVIFSVP